MRTDSQTQKKNNNNKTIQSSPTLCFSVTKAIFDIYIQLAREQQQTTQAIYQATATPHTDMLLASLLTLLKSLFVGFLNRVNREFLA